jgi:hypothetical protein
MQGPLVLPARSETVVSEASLIEDIEVIEYPAFVLAFPLHRLVLNKGTTLLGPDSSSIYTFIQEGL